MKLLTIIYTQYPDDVTIGMGRSCNKFSDLALVRTAPCAMVVLHGPPKILPMVHIPYTASENISIQKR